MTTTNEVPTPELDKRSKVLPDSQKIGEFLDWLLNESGMSICRFDDEQEEFIPEFRSIEQWLADYYGLDLNKIEDEQRALLNALRGG